MLSEITFKQFRQWERYNRLEDIRGVVNYYVSQSDKVPSRRLASQQPQKEVSGDKIYANFVSMLKKR